jgi:hypothetical protein
VAPEFGVVAIVWLVITTCSARVYAGYNYPTDVLPGRLAGEHPYIFYFISFCAAYEVVSLFWDFRFAANNLEAILHN